MVHVVLWNGMWNLCKMNLLDVVPKTVVGKKSNFDVKIIIVRLNNYFAVSNCLSSRGIFPLKMHIMYHITVLTIIVIIVSP
jgi:hypothetical protein